MKMQRFSLFLQHELPKKHFVPSHVRRDSKLIAPLQKITHQRKPASWRFVIVSSLFMGTIGGIAMGLARDVHRATRWQQYKDVFGINR